MSKPSRAERSRSPESEERQERAAQPDQAPAPAMLLQLQQGAGNRAVTTMIARSGKGKGKGKTKKKKTTTGGGQTPSTTDVQGPTTAVVEPEGPAKAKDTPEQRELRQLRQKADASSAAAAKAAKSADADAAEAASIVKELDALRIDPLVTANADVLAEVQSALADATPAGQEAARQAATAGSAADTAAKQAATAATTEPDSWGGNFAATELAKKAAARAVDAEGARGRAGKALNAAKLALRKAQRSRDQVEHAKTWVEGGSGDADAKAAAAIKLADTWTIDTTALLALRANAKRPVKDEQWRTRRTDLNALEEEADRVVGYVASLEAAEERFKSVPVKKDREDVRALITAAKIELLRRPRNDTRCTTALGAIEAKFDALDAAAAVTAGNAAARQQLIADGRLAQNQTVIAAEARSSLAGQEKTAVDEILDAYEAGDAVSPFGGRWGDYHGNNAGNLPGVRGGGGYAEYYVRAATAGAGWGVRRLVRHLDTSRWYYSRTHYGTAGTPAFVLLTGV